MNEEKLLEYYCFRYFVIETNSQRSIFQDLENKKELIRKILMELKDKKKIESLVKNKRCLLYYVKDIDEQIFITKFSKEKHIVTHDARTDDIVEQDLPDYPFIYMLISLDRQIVLLENKSSVFISPFSAQRCIENFFTNFVKQNDYLVKLDEIQYEDKFWEIVERAEQIYSLKLNLKSPNIFGARYKANEFLKEQREYYNNTEMNVELKNDEGNLTLLRENLEDFIKYISAGGGRYLILLKEKGIYQRIKSIINIRKSYLKSLDDEDTFKIKEILEKLDENK